MNSETFQYILKKLKAKKGCRMTDFDELIPQHADLVDPSERRIEHLYPIDALRKLVGWNLVDAYENKRRVAAEEIKASNVSKIVYYLSPFAAELEHTFYVNLTAEPLFGPPSRLAFRPDLFMLMPFTPQMRPIFDDHVKKVASKLELTAARADDFFSRGVVLQDIWSAIYHARVIVADCTKRNPNVFYEIGIAHTLGKETVLISQSLKDVPFDLRHLRHINYEYTPSGMSEFESRLEATLKDFITTAA
jgi:hypothetical protein